MTPTISLVIINKDEPSLDQTLRVLEPQAAAAGAETVVVDASSGRLDAIRDAHPWVRWIAFEQPAGVRVTIPHQRNAGVRAATGDVVVFLDSGCDIGDGWLAALTDPLVNGDDRIACGSIKSRKPGVYGAPEPAVLPDYVDESPTGNLAFRRAVFDEVGGFDETFEYGSDIDFTWRVCAGSDRIRFVPSAVLYYDWGSYDWGSSRRQAKRAFAYGAARGRLYLKHRHRVRRIALEDPVAIAYPLFLLGLPLTLRFRWYPLLLAIPYWRNRHNEQPIRSLGDHLIEGAGVIAQVTGLRTLWH
jgi:hypothetical protein